MFTPQDIQGKNKANPSAMVLSATMLLRHLGLESQANTIASAVYDVIKDSKNRTADLGGGSMASVSYTHLTLPTKRIV